MRRCQFGIYARNYGILISYSLWSFLHVSEIIICINYYFKLHFLFNLPLSPLLLSHPLILSTSCKIAQGVFFSGGHFIVLGHERATLKKVVLGALDGVLSRIPCKVSEC